MTIFFGMLITIITINYSVISTAAAEAQRRLRNGEILGVFEKH
jgi:hypothetical protein